jgi:hypothetical protein
MNIYSINTLIYVIPIISRGGRGPDLHVFYNPPRSERIKKLGSTTRIVNCQSARPRVA